MSKIQGKPFIQKVLDTLNDTLKTTLLGLVNGSDDTPAFRSLINKNNLITDADKNKVQHIILETWNKTYTGYLIYNASHCVLVAYSYNTQDLTVLKINLDNQVYTIVKEQLNILELRFLLGGGGSGGDIPDAIEVNNIAGLSDDQIDGLKPGDLVIKKTGNQKHTYLVTYKEANQGICLTYTDASISETVSYDYSGGHWVYNSTDVTELGGGMSNPMTTANDIIVGGSNGTPTRLAKGSEGQVLKVGASGLEWGSAGGVPTVTIALSQIVGQTPLEIQLTNDQYDVFENNRQVLIDLSELGELNVVWHYYYEESGYISYGFGDYGVGSEYNTIVINKNDKIATYTYGFKDISPTQVFTGTSADEGLLLAMDSNGTGTLTNNLPILTTAPTSANTEGGIIIVVLSSEPATKYSGYLYVITGA